MASCSISVQINHISTNWMWFLVEKSSLHLKATGRLFRLPWLLQTHFCSDIPCRKSKLSPLQELFFSYPCILDCTNRKMIDRVRMWAKGGDGGNGCSSFRRSRHNRRGRADGGNGGRGGDVILECSPSIWDFSGLQRHVNAKRGGHGSSKNLIGSKGADKIVRVPVGTVIHLVEGHLPSTVEKHVSEALDPWDDSSETLNRSREMLTETINSRNSSASLVSTEDKIPPAKTTHQHLSYASFTSRTEDPDSSMEEEHEDVFLGEEHEKGYETDASSVQYDVAELTEPGQQLVIAYGGDGGFGNISTTKPFTRKHNDIDAKVDDDDDDDDGEKYAQRIGMPGSEVILVLELKSIADVGLVGMPNAGKSTLLGAMSRARPTIGDYAFTTLRPNLGNVSYEDFSITVADIPGLISGAHDNRGLGHDFLRHIERTKVLAYVVDLVANIDGRRGIPPWKQLHELVLELEFYREGLSKRPSLVVANKIDETGADAAYEELKRRVHGVQIYPVCAVLEQGVSEVKHGLRMLVNGEALSKLRLDDIVLD